MIGGIQSGYLHGMLNPKDATITGTNISYIYPDMETCLFGRFVDRKMQNAQESSVSEIDCNDYGFPYVTHYSKPDPNSPRFYYESPSNISFGAGPPGILDPYEKKWLELKVPSDVQKGEGIFTKRDLKPGTLVCSYSGFVFNRQNGELDLYKKRCSMNSTKSDDERRHCKKYSLNLWARNSKIIIPPEVDLPDSFIPSWGPKVCQFIPMWSYR